MKSLTYNFQISPADANLDSSYDDAMDNSVSDLEEREKNHLTRSKV